MSEKNIKVAWAVTAVILPILVTIILYLHSKNKTDLSIYAISKNNILNNDILSDNISKNLKVSLGNIEIEKLSVGVYGMKNTGNVAILPKDYITPISIFAEPPWLLYAIQITSPNNDLANSSDIKINVLKDGNFELSPFLLNPTDEFYIITYSIKQLINDANNLKKHQGEPNIIFKGRIVNVINIVKEYNDILKNNLTYYLTTTVYLYGTDIYLFIIIVLLLSILQMLLFIKCDLIKLEPKIYKLFLFAISIIFAMSTSEIIVFLLFNRLRSPIWQGCWALLFFHFIFILYIIGNILFKKKPI